MANFCQFLVAIFCFVLFRSLLVAFAFSKKATAICGRNVEMSAPERGDADVLGSNFVGVVHHCGPVAEELGLRPGM